MKNEPNPKGPTAENESKPVGYGSSIQSDGHGNRTRPQDPDDANPTTQQDQIQKLKEEGEDEQIPKTSGTGANNSVDNGESLIIKKD